MAMELARSPWSGSELARERDFVPLRTMMDRLFESAFTPSFWGNGQAGGFGMDVYENDDAYVVHCALPGIDANSVNVSVQDSVLTISGEGQRTPPENARPLLQELRFGQFQRQVTLGYPVEANNAQAEYHDGILTITLPKAEAAKPRTIKVQSKAS